MIRVTPLFSLGDEQARRGCCAFPEGCRVTDADTNWGSAVSGWNGHMQNSHTWVYLFIIAASYKIITTRSCLCIMHYTLYNNSQGFFVCLFVCRWLWWCSVSVHRDAVDVPRERITVTRHHHSCRSDSTLIYLHMCCLCVDQILWNVSKI